MLLDINPYVAALLAICCLAGYGFRLNRTFRIQARGISIESDLRDENPDE